MYRLMITFALVLGVSLALCLQVEAKQLGSGSREATKASESTPVQVDSAEITPVTVENYGLAESQVIFSDYVKKIAKATSSDGVGEIMHLRKTPDPKDRTILRINFDTIYSFLILDLTSPAIIELPETGGRYQSAEVLDEQHYIPFVFTKPGRYELTKQNVGSRYAIVIFRTQVSIQDSSDMAKVAALQDRLKLEQVDKGEYRQANAWDMEEILALRKQYQERAVTEGTKSEDRAGKKGEISVDMHNFGVAMGWGGRQKKARFTSFSKKPPTTPRP